MREHENESKAREQAQNEHAAAERVEDQQVVSVPDVDGNAHAVRVIDMIDVLKREGFKVTSTSRKVPNNGN